jgi:hypothetical protein
MMIIGCDLHTRYQQIAMLDTDRGELVEGAGPSLMFLARTSAKEAAPALPVLQSWAPRTQASPAVSRDLPDLELPLPEDGTAARSTISTVPL